MSRAPVAEREITLTRVFDAPRDLVWEVWTKAEHVKEWFGPHGFSTPVCEWDARPGGHILIHMQGPDGGVHVMTGVFTEVQEPDRIAFDSTVPDADGSAILETTAAVTLTESDGKTHLTLVSKGIGFTEISKYMLDGMEEGWSQTLERLEARVGGLA